MSPCKKRSHHGAASGSLMNVDGDDWHIGFQSQPCNACSARQESFIWGNHIEFSFGKQAEQFSFLKALECVFRRRHVFSISIDRNGLHGSTDPADDTAPNVVFSGHHETDDTQPG